MHVKEFWQKVGHSFSDHKNVKTCGQCMSLMEKKTEFLFFSFFEFPIFGFCRSCSTGYIGPVCVFVFFVISTIINKLLMSPVVSRVVQQERREGDFRSEFNVRFVVKKIQRAFLKPSASKSGRPYGVTSASSSLVCGTPRRGISPVWGWLAQNGAAWGGGCVWHHIVKCDGDHMIM